MSVDNVNNTYYLALKKAAKNLQAPEKNGYTAKFEDPFSNQVDYLLKPGRIMLR